MEKKKNYLILAYYHLVNIEDPEKEVRAHKNFFKDRDVAGRIYICGEGINGQMSGSNNDASEYMDWMCSRPLFKGIDFKLHQGKENIFAKMTVKTRNEIVALGEKIDLSNRARHVSPKKWKEMLEDDEDYYLLDVRNDYEWKVGHFEGADLPECSTFREFVTFAKDLKNKKDPEKTKVMMYCTGGIRCELYSALLKEEGFDKVYQLEGGVVKYGNEVGSKHWKGKLFVFDDRLTIPISNEETDVISTCNFCERDADKYYNCANMDCNDLFLACDTCLCSFKGCCCEPCMHEKRVRPFNHVDGKPFRKWYHYSETKQEVTKTTV